MRVKNEEYFCSHCNHLSSFAYVASLWQNSKNEKLYECEDCHCRNFENILELDTQDAFLEMQSQINGAREAGL